MLAAQTTAPEGGTSLAGHSSSVLLFDSWHEWGGGETYVARLVAGLSARGFRFTVAATHGPLLAEVRRSGARAVQMRFGPGRHTRDSHRAFLVRVPLMVGQYLWVLIRERHAEQVHMVTFEEQLLATHLARWLRRPVTWSVHGQLVISETRLRSRLYQAAAARTERIIAVSEVVRRSLIDHGVNPSWIAVVHHGLAAAPDSAPSLTRDTPVIGFVGRLEAVKDPLLFLDVAERVLASRPAARFVVFGDGPLADLCRARVREKGLGQAVVLAGHVTDRDEIYRGIDILLMPSQAEGLPMALLEAGSAGLPVVAPAIEPFLEVLTDGVTGLLRPRDANSLAEGALLLLEEARLRERLGQALQADVRERFTLDRMLAETARVFDDAAG